MEFIMYDSGNYASTRLGNCFIWEKKKGMLFFVRTCTGTKHIKIIGSYVPDGVEAEVPIENFDLSFQKMGFTYYGGQALYLMKKPMRRDWKQGIRASNVKVYSVNCSKFRNFDFRVIPLGKVNSCIKGEHMGLEEAMEEAYNNECSVPISRKFFIHPSDSVNTFHLGHACDGIIGNIVDGRALLEDDFNYLSESYERSFNNAY